MSETNQNQPGNESGNQPKETLDLSSLKASLDGLTKTLTEAMNFSKQNRENSGNDSPNNEDDTIDPAVGDESSEDDLDGLDLETLSRADLVRLIEASIGKKLTEKFAKEFVAPVSQRLDLRDQAVEIERLTTEVNRLRNVHPDYNDWTDEMIQISKENPTLSPLRVYNLARLENPEKAKTLKAKYPPKDEVEANARRNSNFFSLPTETSGKTNRPPMSTREAAESALSEVISRHGDVFAE